MNHLFTSECDTNPIGSPAADPDRFAAAAAADAAPVPSTANGAALGLGGRLCPAALPTLTMERGKTAAFTIGEQKLAVAVHNNYKTFNREAMFGYLSVSQWRMDQFTLLPNLSSHFLAIFAQMLIQIGTWIGLTLIYGVLH